MLIEAKEVEDGYGWCAAIALSCVMHNYLAALNVECFEAEVLSLLSNETTCASHVVKIRLLGDAIVLDANSRLKGRGQRE